MEFFPVELHKLSCAYYCVVLQYVKGEIKYENVQL